MVHKDKEYKDRLMLKAERVAEVGHGEFWAERNHSRMLPVSPCGASCTSWADTRWVAWISALNSS